MKLGGYYGSDHCQGNFKDGNDQMNIFFKNVVLRSTFNSWKFSSQLKTYQILKISFSPSMSKYI